MSLVAFDPAHTRIKICGLRTPAAVQTAVELAIDAIGLVFYAPSPRVVSMAQAEMLSHSHGGRLENVALVVDATDTLITDIQKYCQVDLWQFHGEETPQRCAEIAQGKNWIKAARIDEKFLMDEFCLQYRDASAWILDAVVEGYGGGGKTFNWELVPQAWLKAFHHKVILSGGLHVANVSQAIAHFRPLGVDVSSGVELVKGVKDEQLMKNFVTQVRTQSVSLNFDEKDQ